MTTEFQPFPKIPRWSRDIIITEKIDGTNACVVVEQVSHDEFPSDSPEVAGVSETVWRITAQSRTRFITPESDNHGFAAWVRDHVDELKALGPGRHFGEWWGRGINRKYGQTERHFSLFNVSRWNGWVFNTIEAGKFRKPGETVPVFVPPPACCKVVPVLYHGANAACEIQRCVDDLRNVGSYAAPGWRTPEGIVIYHTAGGCLFKKTLENDERAKGAQ
jgi:hypothetical protein